MILKPASAGAISATDAATRGEPQQRADQEYGGMRNVRPIRGD